MESLDQAALAGASSNLRSLGQSAACLMWKHAWVRLTDASLVCIVQVWWLGFLGASERGDDLPSMMILTGDILTTGGAATSLNSQW